MKEELIAGWVAWHPFFRGFNDSKSVRVYDRKIDAKNELEIGQQNKYLESDYWRIRPVEIRFTDKGEE